MTKGSQNADPREMMAAYLDGSLNADQVAELEAYLREDRERAKAAVHAAMLECHMTELLREQNLQDLVASNDQSDKLDSNDSTALAKALEHLAQLHKEGLQEPIKLDVHRKSHDRSVDHVSRRTKLKARLIITGGLAAVVTISAAVALVVSMLAQPTQNTPIVEQPADDLIIVATLTGTHNAKWDEPKPGGDDHPSALAHDDLRPGTQLAAGRQLTLTEGFAEITTNRGAIALIEAPATIELLDNNNAIRLHAGKLVGICETELSQGFVVKTDYADITDLGTEFGVEVRDNQLTATVFSGEVEFTTPGQAPKPLVTNQTATLDDRTGARLVVQERVAEGFTLRLPRITTAEQIQSTAKPIAAWDFHGSDPKKSPGIHVGDASTPSGLKMTGFVGQWSTMPLSQGATVTGDKTTGIGEATGVSNGITLRWAVDGVGATRWAWQPGSKDAAHPLFGDYYYINRKPGRWGGAAIPWRIEGLTPGARYDIIFFGTGSHYQNGASISIQGHDAGNGIGQAATLDDENDANFMSVIAGPDGTIAGTFGNPGDAEAQVAGVQIGLVPKAESPHQQNNQSQR